MDLVVAPDEFVMLAAGFLLAPSERHLRMLVYSGGLRYGT
jgi:hypothetical protein